MILLVVVGRDIGEQDSVDYVQKKSFHCLKVKGFLNDLG